MKTVKLFVLVFVSLLATLAVIAVLPLSSPALADRSETSTQMTGNNVGNMQDMGMNQKKEAQAEEAQDKKVRDPVCSMMVDPKKAEKSVYKGKTYHFCSKEDKAAFEESPEKYLKQGGMHHMGMRSDMPMCCKGKMGRKAPTETQEDTRQPTMESMDEQKDPVCGMTVDPKTAQKSVHKGKTYYFCSKADKEAFEKSPEKYLKKETDKKPS